MPEAERFLADTLKALEQHQAAFDEAENAWQRRWEQVEAPLAAARLAELAARRSALAERAREVALERGRERLAIVAAENALKPK